MIINSIVHISNKNPLIISNTYRMWQGSLKLYPHPPERRLHHHSLWSWLLHPEWGAGAQVWPRHCISQRLCRLGCFVTSAVTYLPLCWGVGRAHRQSPGAAFMLLQQNSLCGVVHPETTSAAARFRKPPLCTTFLFAEEPTCGEFAEPWKTSCLPPAPVSLCATRCTL